MSATPALWVPQLERRRRIGRIFAAACLLLTLGAIAVLLFMIAAVLKQGWNSLTVKFLTNMPSLLTPEESGMNNAIWGTLWLIGLTGLFSVPVGAGAAIYLEEYARDNRLTRFIKLNIANLAGVPSIVYGILGLALFVRWMHLDRSVIAGALTMSLLILPVIIIASREALAAVPTSIREAAFALGASRWQTVRHHVLPAALPGMMTGVILALSRAIGETAPLIMIGALTWVTFTPGGAFFEEYPHTLAGGYEWFTTALTDQFTVMPIQIFNWTSRPDSAFHQNAAAAGAILVAMTLTMNAIAIWLRYRLRKNIKW